jgi:hypothetical protein
VTLYSSPLHHSNKCYAWKQRRSDLCEPEDGNCMSYLPIHSEVRRQASIWLTTPPSLSSRSPEDRQVSLERRRRYIHQGTSTLLRRQYPGQATSPRLHTTVSGTRARRSFSLEPRSSASMFVLCIMAANPGSRSQRIDSTKHTGRYPHTPGRLIRLSTLLWLVQDSRRHA